MSTQRLLLLLAGFAALLMVIASLWLAMPSFTNSGEPPAVRAEGASR
ncbi:MAG: hypothetical protein ACI9MC_000087 [Kiritimatiellia bacterium]|jgi:hypothetical protein